METSGRAKKASQLRDILLTLEGQVVTLKESMGDVKGELTIYKTALGNGGFAMTPKPNVDVPKPKEFKGSRSTYVRRGGTKIGTWEEY
ncbi:hypothetical protein J1N35_005162 [Gossypium stocksii]|uniref:Uncharacterized protein n=1 Tax=Gossypium stocksii TaxID=47602 RepID=A0A9D3WE25_9ROSI|nr:hypothetical protein J1N35_005162 [Gossypium stocksii]